jgi:hypothetical protein
MPSIVPAVTLTTRLSACNASGYTSPNGSDACASCGATLADRRAGTRCCSSRCRTAVCRARRRSPSAASSRDPDRREDGERRRRSNGHAPEPGDDGGEERVR